MESLNDWTQNIEKKNHQSVAYIDLAKAFDSVCHNKLLLKLLAYGICGTLLSWISSFLSNRHSQTRIGSCLSSAMLILSGVVQGSYLGILLFTVLINDISDLFSGDACVKLFADDVKLYSKVCTNPDSLQEGLNSIVEWSHTWQVPISESKYFQLESVVRCCIFYS